MLSGKVRSFLRRKHLSPTVKICQAESMFRVLPLRIVARPALVLDVMDFESRYGTTTVATPAIPLRSCSAYAPSILLQNDTHHVFFCSGGSISPVWNYIRYVNSTDGGRTWSVPVNKLHTTAFSGTITAITVQRRALGQGIGAGLAPVCEAAM